jgi:prefoldin subunit 5
MADLDSAIERLKKRIDAETAEAGTFGKEGEELVKEAEALQAQGKHAEAGDKAKQATKKFEAAHDTRCRVEGKLEAMQILMEERIKELEDTIKKLQEQIKKLEAQGKKDKGK